MARKIRTGASGYDPIGPFHPFLVWAAVLLLDIAAAAAIVAGLTWAVDKAEDRMAPGGEEWIGF